MKKSVITLLTDFGITDYYVASMKGVILSINPGCTFVDISHQVKPHDIMEGAFLLANAYSYFPKGTIHLSVVDPGVGSPRKSLLIWTTKYYFVGPDNGLFTLVMKKEKVRQVISLTNESYFLPSISTTFHGRDIFAPVAAHLSMGVEPRAFGNIIPSWKELSVREPRVKAGEMGGEILHIDAFGNLITNITKGDLSRFAKSHSVMIKVGNRTVRGLKRGYWAGRRGEPMALFGSAGFLEISVREGNVQKMLKVKKGDPITAII